MRQLAHFALVMLGTVPWLVAYWAGALSMLLTVAADRVWPDADRGNCWSHALPKWRGHRALVLTFVDDARFLRWFPVVHCALLPEFPRRSSYEMTQPVERRKTAWFPWFTFCFRFKIIRHDRVPKPTDTDHAPLGE